MKKILVGILATVTVLSIGTTTAFAAAPRTGRNVHGVCGYFGSVCSHVDADNDGVCDNCGSYHRNCKTGNVPCQNFADADGNGVCDNCDGYHGNCQTGNASCQNFTDTDGNGVCDNYPAGQAKWRQNASHHGRHGHHR